MKNNKLKILVLDLLHLQNSKGKYLSIEEIQQHIPEKIRNAKTTLKQINCVLDGYEKSGIAKNTARGYELRNKQK